MSTRPTSVNKTRKRAIIRRKNSRGAALITSLLLLLLLSGLTVAMVVTANSDMLINGYYRGFRGSFYAADSGLTVARQAMINQLLAAGTTGFSLTAQPIPVGTEGVVVSSVNSTYGSYQTLNAGQGANSWPESFKLDTTATTLGAPTCTVVGGGGTCAAPTGSVTGYQYVYNYSLRGFGRSSGNQVTTLTDSGTIKINVAGTAANTTTSFAAYGMFSNTYNICDGSTLVAGTISGPVFTNGSWNFGTGGSYIFTDKVGSAGSNFGYQFSGKCDQSSATSDKSGNTTIAPTFQGGVNLGAPTVPLPANDYNQKRAVLDGMGVGATSPSNAEMNAAFKDVTGSPWPNNGNKTTGVFLPYSINASTGAKTFTGGGIYVKGDASVVLQPTGSNGAQQYVITQGSTVTTVTVDVVGGTTTISSGGTTQTISGVPDQLNPSTGAVQRDATMLYVDGNITSLKGPGQGQAALSDQTALTITAAGNVTVTGDIIYTSKPVTTTQNQIPNTPADTLIPANDHGQALGIFTATGDIQMANSQSNGNLEIDASIATISQNGSGGLINTGSAINTLTIIGGRIQNNIKNINTTTRNVFFDRRYAQNGFAPPWFPSTTVTSTAPTQSQYTSTVQRLKWLNQTAYY